MHERVPSEYDGRPPSGLERLAYFAAWITLAALIAAFALFIAFP